LRFGNPGRTPAVCLTASGKGFPEFNAFFDIGKCIVKPSVDGKTLSERHEDFIRRDKCEVSWINHVHRSFHSIKQNHSPAGWEIPAST
jgi:hypothetical protein